MIDNLFKTSPDAASTEEGGKSVSQLLVDAGTSVLKKILSPEDSDNNVCAADLDSEEEIGNTEELYADHVDALQKAVYSAPEKPKDVDWETVKTEKDKLVNNTTNFLTIQHIYEKICRLPLPNASFYNSLLARSQGNDSELKTLFFKELEQQKVGFFTQLCARIQYYFYSNIVKYYVAKAGKVYFEEIFNYIEQHKKENFETLRNQITTNFTRYLTILRGVYRKVANNSSPSGTPHEMVQEELGKKESNLGFETKELYSEFSHIVMKKTFESSFIGWIGKKLIKPKEVVRFIVDKSWESIQDKNGYTHALNCVILEQLEYIWKFLQRRLHSSAKEPNGKQT